MLNPFAGLEQGAGALPMEQTDRTVAETLNVSGWAPADLAQHPSQVAAHSYWQAHHVTRRESTQRLRKLWEKK